jgi:hypothetical protein
VHLRRNKSQFVLNSFSDRIAEKSSVMDIAKLLSVSVAPVVLISASGLILLALYNRLGLLYARVRNFHREKMALIKDIEREDGADRRLLLNMISTQIARVMSKARLTVRSISTLLCAIASFVLCSLCSAIGTLFPWFNYVAFAFHLIGLGLFLIAVGIAIVEIRRSIRPMEEENAYLDFYSSGLD